MMKITLNGEAFDLDGKSIPALIVQIDAIADHVAVMVNGSVAARESWNEKILSEGDSIEVLTFAAGG